MCENIKNKCIQEVQKRKGWYLFRSLSFSPSLCFSCLSLWERRRKTWVYVFQHQKKHTTLNTIRTEYRLSTQSTHWKQDTFFKQQCFERLNSSIGSVIWLMVASIIQQPEITRNSGKRYCPFIFNLFCLVCVLFVYVVFYSILNTNKCLFNTVNRSLLQC